MLNKIKNLFSKEVPFDVKVAIGGIAISWFFWGPADAYAALFLKSFGSDYAQIGWLISLSKFVPLLLAIPFGILADKVSARRLVILSLIGFFFVPIAYFYAGLKMSLSILIIAILMNGILQVLRNIAMLTYIKEKTPPELSGKVMSIFEGITNGFWGLGLASGSILVLYFGYHQLFLFACVGILIKIFAFAKVSEVEESSFHLHFPQIRKLSFLSRVKRAFTYLTTLDIRIWLMLLVNLGSAITIGTSDIFMTLFIENLNFGIVAVGLVMGGVYASNFFVVPINKWAMRFGKFGSMSIGFLGVMLCSIAIVLFAEQSIYTLFAAFFFQLLIFMSLVKPTRNGIIAGLTPRHLQGEINGIQQACIYLGNMLGAIAFGYVADIWGLPMVFTICGIIYAAGMFACLFLWVHYEHTVKHVHVHPHMSYLHMFHVGSFGHALPDKHNKYTHIK